MMVDVHSSLFPVAGAAKGSLVDYGLALEFVAAPSIEAARPIIADIRRRHGDEAYIKLHRLIHRAIAEGRLQVRRWRP